MRLQVDAASNQTRASLDVGMTEEQSQAGVPAHDRNSEQRSARAMSSASTRGTSSWVPSAPASPDAFISGEDKHPSIQYCVVGPSADIISPLGNTKNSKGEIAEQIAEAMKRLATARGFNQGNGEALTMTADLGFYKSPEKAESGSSTIRLSAAGGIESIVANMRKHPIDRTLQLEAWSTLCDYVETSAADTDTAVALGFIDCIVAAMRSQAQDSELQQWACHSLKILSQRDKRLEVVAAGGIELIIEAIRSHQNDIDVQLLACKALSTIAETPPPLRGARRAEIQDYSLVHDLGEKITEAGMCLYACKMQEGM